MLASAALALLLSVAAEPAMAAPRLRLPGDVRPLRESVELVLDPAAESFSGSVEIELEVLRPTAVVWLNATRLELTAASLGDDGRRRPARVLRGGEDFVGLAADRPLQLGRAWLAASFAGKVSRIESDGVFSVRERGEWYLFSQFEPIAARQAFPCFDEPSYKIPWTLTLRVPRGLVALSNTPAAASGREGPRDVTLFAPTRPLPSYLVALAVGPFDLVDTGRAGRAGTPTRLVVPKGRAAETAWARETTPRILRLLEDYFDRPYPYEKLDQLAIPSVSFAMEHPGLVTYGADLLLQGAGDAVESRREWVSVCAHELAHQWFGDLVTMAWWDDTWLNEAFASWLGEKIDDRFRPEWGVAIERVQARSEALEADGLASARRLRQPIVSNDDIANAFDGITYAKGEAVLEMIESWLGEDAFRRAVRAYVNAHAWGTATAGDFVSALSAATGVDAARALSSFLDQTGAPVVRAELRCDAAPALLLSQRPYRPLGSPAVEQKTWSVPVCVDLGTGGRRCSVLSDGNSEIALNGHGCPDWSFPNADAAGYYRTALPAGQARRALEHGGLGIAERVCLAGDLGALAASGDVPASEALGLVPLLARDPDRHVVESAVALLQQLERIVPDALLPAFSAYVRGALGGRAAGLGWSSRPGESDELRLLRRTLLPAAVRLGRDDALARDALPLASDWLEQRTPADPDMIDALLSAAAGAGDRALFDRLRSEALRSPDRARRQRLIGALGAVRDPALAGEALALTLDDRIDARESVRILLELGSQRETQGLAFDFVRDHYDGLASRLPGGSPSPLSALPWIGVRLCTPEARSELEAFFAPRLARLEGGPRSLQQALESADQCVAQKQAQLPSLSGFLRATPVAVAR